MYHSRPSVLDNHITSPHLKSSTSKFKPSQTYISTGSGSNRTSERDDVSAAATGTNQDAVVVAPDDKLLITISYPPGNQSSKFKVKGKHNVGKVLLSACNAFGLDYDS